MRFIKTQVFRYATSQYVALDNIAHFYISAWQFSTGDVWRICAADRQGNTHTLAVYATRNLAQLTLDTLIRAITRTEEAVLQEWDDVSTAYAPEPPTETLAAAGAAS